MPARSAASAPRTWGTSFRKEARLAEAAPRAVVLAGPIAGAPEDLRFEGGGADVTPLARDAEDAVVAHLDPHALRAAQSRQPAQVDLPRVAVASKLAGGVGRTGRLGIRQP